VDECRAAVGRSDTAVDGTDETTLIQSRVDAIRRHAREDVHSARIEKTRDSLVAAVILHQLPGEVQRGHTTAPLRGVHVPVDDQRRLFERRSGLFVCQCQKPDRPALRCRTDAFELDEIRPRRRPGLEKFRQFVVAEDVVEGKRRNSSERIDCCQQNQRRDFLHRLRAFSRIGRIRSNSARRFSAENAVKPKASPGRVGSTA
jgi:hypothetical protein